jgi:hypothetical protein
MLIPSGTSVRALRTTRDSDRDLLYLAQSVLARRPMQGRLRTPVDRAAGAYWLNREVLLLVAELAVSHLESRDI